MARELGMRVKTEFEKLGKRFTDEVRKRLAGVFPPEPEADCRPDGYLWARTIRCPYCEGLVPLSPNWRLAPDGTNLGITVATRVGRELADLAHATGRGQRSLSRGTLPRKRCTAA